MEGTWPMSDGPSLSESLLARIARRTLTCGVVGLGYVGLPLAVVLAQAGFAVVGFDADPQKIAAVCEGRSYIPDVSSQVLACLVEQGALRADCAFDSIADCDFVAICVPTPLDAHGDPDISCIEGAARSVGEYLAPGTMVVLESTTYPGTTQDIVLSLLQRTSGLRAGRDFYVGFSPERVDPGNGRYTTANTPKVVGAADPDGLACIAAVYEAALGCTVDVPTPGGATVRLKVPAGTQTGKKFRFKEMGAPDVKHRGRTGALLVEIKVQVPTNLSDDERDAMTKLREADTRDYREKVNRYKATY